ncbi:alpha/beta hydrolase [Candidatus Poriferisocius sp.]|uniref:alpha/beta hydrolase n=1 Tax=Candidatus Poriferisocius sp. TaxID=3101276 RepID=UPI003B0297D3
MPSDAYNAAVAALRQQMQAAAAAPPPDLATTRAGFETAYSSMPVADGVSFAPVDAGGVPAEWVTPAEVEGNRAIIYLHGGGYVVGNLNTHRHVVSRLAAEAKARLLNVDYRLAPENPYPAALDDAVAAWQWHLANGGEAAHTAISGDSAGGGLTIALCMKLRDEGLEQPACAAPISPWTDLTFSGDSMTERAERDPMLAGADSLHGMVMSYAQSVDATDPYVSPVFGTFDNLAPMMIQVGTEEVLYDDSTRVVKGIENANGSVEFRPWQDMMHVWHLLASIAPEAEEGIAEMAEYISTRT